MSTPTGRPLAWICINGILSDPGDAEGWTDRAVTWLHLRTWGKAEKFEYACGALTRRLRQQWRAEAIAKMAGYYIRAGYDVIFVAHSNGCDLVERVLQLLYPHRVRSAHLFAPACDGAGLARAIDARQLRTLHLYGSAHDRALKLAGLSSRLLSPVSRLLGVPLGYGDLGLRVESFAEDHDVSPAAIHAHRDDAHDHSSWFARGVNFERTMLDIVRHENLSAIPLP